MWSLQNLNTGTSQTAAKPTANGDYQFLQTRLGRYIVVAAASRKSKRREFEVTVGAKQRVDVALQVGDVAETVQVESRPPWSRAESSDRGQVVNHEEVVNLPLNGRSSASLALLAPASGWLRLGEARISFNVSGLRSQFNNFILDGVDNNAYGTSNQGLSNQVVQVSPDALQEFKVITNSYSAEYGRVGGAVVNASVRSGTNQLHGAALGVSAQYGSERGRLLQASRRAEAGVHPEPVRRRGGWAHQGRQNLPLRRLRRSAAAAAFALLRERAHAGAAHRQLWTLPVKNPYSRSVYSNGIIPAALSPSSGPKCSATSRRRICPATPRTSPRSCRPPITTTRATSAATITSPTRSPSSRATATVSTTNSPRRTAESPALRVRATASSRAS